MNVPGYLQTLPLLEPGLFMWLQTSDSLIKLAVEAMTRKRSLQILFRIG